MGHIDTQLINVCLAQGHRISGVDYGSEPVNGARLLLTIAGLESSFGEKRLFVRYEPGYGPEGHYYKASEMVRRMWSVYGVLAASSFGAFQIMHATARELGFTGSPIGLQSDEICAYWATTLIVNRIIKDKGAKTLEQVLDAYNSGSCNDTNVPARYIAKGVQIYQNLDSI